MTATKAETHSKTKKLEVCQESKNYIFAENILQETKQN